MPHHPERQGQSADATAGQVTTLVIKNVPAEYTQDELFQEFIDALGSISMVDFFYLPWDNQQNAHAGYALINLMNASIVPRARQIFSNYKWRGKSGMQITPGKASQASIQGLENLIRNFQDVAADGHPNGPIVVWNGNKIELSKVFEQLRGIGGGPRNIGNLSTLAKAPAPHPHRQAYPGCGGDGPMAMGQGQASVQRMSDSNEDGAAEGSALGGMGSMDYSRGDMPNHGSAPRIQAMGQDGDAGQQAGNSAVPTLAAMGGGLHPAPAAGPPGLSPRVPKDWSQQQQQQGAWAAGPETKDKDGFAEITVFNPQEDALAKFTKKFGGKN